ncbi:MAG TPA: DUF1634 domain-containing protein [Verrucomicrobiae bacterium]|nr:DUF1634 domain-containing protein [Verrucomicrobiae bacterium]
MAIGTLLRTGVVLSALLVFVGGMVYVFRHPSIPINYRTFSGEPDNLRHIAGIVQASLSFHGRAIIQLGLLLLIATPVMRVAFSVFAFAMEKDWKYVVVTLIVLVLLLYSLTEGHL